MTNNGKRYHLANIIVITLTFLSGILLTRMGQMADAGQISMGAPGMTTLSALLFMILGGGVIWIVVSTLVNKNIQAVVPQRIYKSFVGIVVLFVLLIAFSLLVFPMALVFVMLAVYLLITSSKALVTHNYETVSNQ